MTHPWAESTGLHWGSSKAEYGGDVVRIEDLVFHWNRSRKFVYAYSALLSSKVAPRTMDRDWAWFQVLRGLVI
jgi:hypothetical protein